MNSTALTEFSSVWSLSTLLRCNWTELAFQFSSVIGVRATF